MSKRKHTHKYIRGRLGEKHVIFRCAFPDCTHYLAKEFVIGKLSVCNRCGEDFIMTRASVSLAKPHCESCTKSPKAEEQRNIKDFLEKVGL